MTNKTFNKALLIVDHGSRLESSNEQLPQIKNMVEEILKSGAADTFVTYAHMELAEPSIEDSLKLCIENGALDITVQPYMLGAGRHATKDIPRIVKTYMADHPQIRYRVSAPLGVHHLLAKLVVIRSGLNG